MNLSRLRLLGLAATASRTLAAAIALHGMGLWLLAAIDPQMPERVQEFFFWILVVPAMLLAAPFIPVLWALGLMNAPGWFAWPKPLGMVLVYAAWVVALLGLASIARRAAGARRQP